MVDRRVPSRIALVLLPLCACSSWAYGATSLPVRNPRSTTARERLVRLDHHEDEGAVASDTSSVEPPFATAPIDELLTISTSVTPPLAAQDLRLKFQSDLATTGHDIAIPLNEQVLSYLALFQGRLHDFIETGLKRGSKYLPMIQGVFRAEGLPLDLAYVPLIESAFDPNALSRAKAKGVWQFMEGTGSENGLRTDWFVDERSDPTKATVAAAKYLKNLATLFSGDWHLALASYNGGPYRVQKAIQRLGVENFWDLASNPTALPRETREYVPMILAAMIIARNPTQYGFAAEVDSATAFDAVTLSRPVDLRRVAEWTGTTLAGIRALNPELRRWTTPLKDAQYELKVPAGTAERVSEKLQQKTPAIDLVSLNWYVVASGDTMASVAKKLGVTQYDLAAGNSLKKTALLTVGQKLMVPREGAVPAAARPVRVASDRQPGPVQTALVAQPAADSNRVKVAYVVREGDTLTSIAKNFKTTVASLQTWNSLQSDHIEIGDRLTVFTPREVPAD
jgi:membrane-bound lytic murein transglycosylase D